MKAVIAGSAADAERQMLQHVQGSLGRRAIDELAQDQR
jgi:hypothetical protein